MTLSRLANYKTSITFIILQINGGLFIYPFGPPIKDGDNR